MASPSVSFISNPFVSGTFLFNKRQPCSPLLRTSSSQPLHRFSISTTTILAKAKGSKSGSKSGSKPGSKPGPKSGSKSGSKSAPKLSSNTSSDSFSSFAAGPSARKAPRITRRSSPTENQSDTKVTSEDSANTDVNDSKQPKRAVRALGTTQPTKKEPSFSTRKTAADFIAEGIVDDADEDLTLPVPDIQFGVDDIKDPFKEQGQKEEEEKLQSEKEAQKSSIGQFIDVTGDGNVKKKLIRISSGPVVPANAEVVVEYTGKLEDGTVFDSSRQRNDSFSFRLGAGTVIKGWEAAVATMRVGEVAEFSIAPLYAYGKRGMPPVIPGNATLTFEIELLEGRGEEKTDVQRVADFNPDIPRTPQEIASSYEEKLDSAAKKKKRSFFERIYFISPFMSQTGERPPWWINPNITFIFIAAFTAIGFYLVVISGAVHVGYVDEPIDVNIFK